MSGRMSAVFFIMTRSLKFMKQCIFVMLMSAALVSCGDTELYLYSPTDITSDIVVHVTQSNDGPWSVTYEDGPRKKTDVWPLGDTITIRFSADEDGHTLSIPEFGTRLPSVAGQTSQSFFAVRKPIEVEVRCADHPGEDIGLRLKFE